MNDSDIRFRTVIFDLDGTLLDTLEDLYRSVNYALESCGYALRSRSEVRRFVGNGVRMLMARAVPDGTQEQDMLSCLAVFKEHYGAHMNDHTKPYPGIPEALLKLKEAGCLIGVVSNKFDAAVKSLCTKHFSGLFDTAIGESPLIAKKPAPDTVYQALCKLSAPKEGAVYVGDSEVDIQTARNAGLPCISVSWGFRERNALLSLNPDYLCGTVEEMLTAVLERYPSMIFSKR